MINGYLKLKLWFIAYLSENVLVV